MKRFSLIIRTMILFGSIWCHSDRAWAASVNCSCPAKDPLAKPSCGPEPEKLYALEDHSPQCKTNKTVSKDSFDTFVKLIDSQSKSKNYSEIGNYISCYRRNDKQFCHFKETLSSHILLAAESAGLSPAVQACEFLQESQFIADPPHDAHHTSLGYVQFEPGTISTMSKIVSQGYLEKCNKRLADVMLKIKSPQYKGEADQRYLDSRSRVLKAEIAARKAWDNYWKGTKNTPTSITENSVKCPQIAFAIAVSKQLYDLNLIKGIQNNGADNDIRIGTMDEIDSGVYLSGAYNAGIGGLSRRCKTTHTLQECIDKFKPRSNGEEFETHKHMRSIRSCALKNNWEPMNNDRKKNCETSQCM